MNNKKGKTYEEALQMANSMQAGDVVTVDPFIVYDKNDYLNTPEHIQPLLAKIDFLVKRIEELEGAIEEMGNRYNECTRGVTGKTCKSCECKRKSNI